MKLFTTVILPIVKQTHTCLPPTPTKRFCQHGVIIEKSGVYKTKVGTPIFLDKAHPTVITDNNINVLYTITHKARACVDDTIKLDNGQTIEIHEFTPSNMPAVVPNQPNHGWLARNAEIQKNIGAHSGDKVISQTPFINKKITPTNTDD